MQALDLVIEKLTEDICIIIRPLIITGAKGQIGGA